METNNTVPTLGNTGKAKRSTLDGVEQSVTFYREDDSAYEVPLFYCLRGASADDAAKSLGCRILKRGEQALAIRAGIVIIAIIAVGVPVPAVKS